MKKILVIGSCGAGKSTFSLELSKLLKIPVIHLDAHYWRPGWIEPEADTWQNTVRNLIAGEKWIMDGNYGGTLPLRLTAADTVFWLNFTRNACLNGVFKRQLGISRRADHIAGCPERITWEFIKYVWDFPRTRTPKIEKLLRQNAADKQVFIFQNRREMNTFLSNETKLISQKPKGQFE